MTESTSPSLESLARPGDPTLRSARIKNRTSPRPRRAKHQSFESIKTSSREEEEHDALSNSPSTFDATTSRKKRKESRKDKRKGEGKEKLSGEKNKDKKTEKAKVDLEEKGKDKDRGKSKAKKYRARRVQDGDDRISRSENLNSMVPHPYLRGCYVFLGTFNTILNDRLYKTRNFPTSI
jgi:hypothetical protein